MTIKIDAINKASIISIGDRPIGRLFWTSGSYCIVTFLCCRARYTNYLQFQSASPLLVRVQLNWYDYPFTPFPSCTDTGPAGATPGWQVRDTEVARIQKLTDHFASLTRDSRNFVGVIDPNIAGQFRPLHVVGH
eukprot:scaffold384841_cov17-Prasinocladus_malaysianus.AAC.1